MSPLRQYCHVSDVIGREKLKTVSKEFAKWFFVVVVAKSCGAKRQVTKIKSYTTGQGDMMWHQNWQCDTWDTGLAYKQNKIMWVSWILDLLLADDDKTAVFVHKQHKNLLWVAFYRFCQTKFSAWLPVSYRSSGNLDKSPYLAWIWKISNFSVRTFVTHPSIHPYLYLALHPFSAVNHGLRLEGANFHFCYFTLSCKPLQCEATV